MVQQPLLDQELLTVQASQSHSVRLLWACDQPDSVTFAWKHTTLTKIDIHALDEIRTHNLSKWATADPRLITCCHWNGHVHNFTPPNLDTNCAVHFQNYTFLLLMYNFILGLYWTCLIKLRFSILLAMRSIFQHDFFFHLYTILTNFLFF